MDDLCQVLNWPDASGEGGWNKKNVNGRADGHTDDIKS